MQDPGIENTAGEGTKRNSVFGWSGRSDARQGQGQSPQGQILMRPPQVWAALRSGTPQRDSGRVMSQMCTQADTGGGGDKKTAGHGEIMASGEKEVKRREVERSVFCLSMYSELGTARWGDPAVSSKKEAPGSELWSAWERKEEQGWERVGRGCSILDSVTLKYLQAGEQCSQHQPGTSPMSTSPMCTPARPDS